MTLSDIIPTIVTLLRVSESLSTLEILTAADDSYNTRLEQALSEKGLALVVVQSAGQLKDRKSPVLYLENSVMVTVLENPATNQTGVSALAIVEEVLKQVHGAMWKTEKGLKGRYSVDTPAYEMGPLEGGLITYFCNFHILTIHEN